MISFYQKRQIKLNDCLKNNPLVMSVILASAHGKT